MQFKKNICKHFLAFKEPLQLQLETIIFDNCNYHAIITFYTESKLILPKFNIYAHFSIAFYLCKTFSLQICDILPWIFSFTTYLETCSRDTSI